MTTAKSGLDHVLAMVVCVGVVSVKNYFFAQSWPPLSEMNVLSSFVLFILFREQTWGFALMVILSAGLLLDVLSFSPFGVNLLLLSCLSVLGLIWIELFEKDLLLAGGFFLVVTLFDWVFIHFVAVVTGSIRYPSSATLMVLLLSIPVNALLFLMYHSLVPSQEIDHVE